MGTVCNGSADLREPVRVSVEHRNRATCRVTRKHGLADIDAAFETTGRILLVGSSDDRGNGRSGRFRGPRLGCNGRKIETRRQADIAGHLLGDHAVRDGDDPLHRQLRGEPRVCLGPDIDAGHHYEQRIRGSGSIGRDEAGVTLLVAVIRQRRVENLQGRSIVGRPATGDFAGPKERAGYAALRLHESTGRAGAAGFACRPTASLRDSHPFPW